MRAAGFRLACAAAMVPAVAGGSALSARGPQPPKLPPIPPGPLATTSVLPPPVPLPAGAATIAVPGVTAQSPQQTLVATGHAMWTASGPHRIDPASNRTAGPFTPGVWQDVGAGAGSLWVTDFDRDLVRRLDPATGRLRAVVRLPHDSGPAGVVEANRAVWVAAERGGTLLRIDPATNRVAGRTVLTPPGAGGPRTVAAGFGSLWVAAPGVDAVFRIDPAARRIRAIVRFPVSMSPCGSIAVGTRSVWVGGCFQGSRVGRIDPATNRLESVLEVAGETAQLRAQRDSVWFVATANPDREPLSYLVRLRRDRAEVRYQLPAQFVAGGVALAFGSIWLADLSHPRVIRVPFPG
jgi:streptogramin lyase